MPPSPNLRRAHRRGRRAEGRGLTPATYLFFTNECVGLGHLKRALALASAVTERDPEASALIVTGSPVEMAHPLPQHVDTVKLPMVARDSSGLHAGRLGIDLPDVREMRSQLSLVGAGPLGPPRPLGGKARP